MAWFCRFSFSIGSDHVVQSNCDVTDMKVNCKNNILETSKKWEGGADELWYLQNQPTPYIHKLGLIHSQYDLLVYMILVINVIYAYIQRVERQRITSQHFLINYKILNCFARCVRLIMFTKKYSYNTFKKYPEILFRRHY